MSDNRLAFSTTGQKDISGSGTITPGSGFTIFAIQVETDITVTSCAWAAGYAGPAWASRVLLAGQIYYGRWASLTIASGTGIAHFA